MSDYPSTKREYWYKNTGYHTRTFWAEMVEKMTHRVRKGEVPYGYVEDDSNTSKYRYRGVLYCKISKKIVCYFFVPGEFWKWSENFESDFFIVISVSRIVSQAGFFNRNIQEFSVFFSIFGREISAHQIGRVHSPSSEVICLLSSRAIFQLAWKSEFPSTMSHAVHLRLFHICSPFSEMSYFPVLIRCFRFLFLFRGKFDTKIKRITTQITIASMIGSISEW